MIRFSPHAGPILERYQVVYPHSMYRLSRFPENGIPCRAQINGDSTAKYILQVDIIKGLAVAVKTTRDDEIWRSPIA
jgi:hypothetical protein